jgi:hypothetical protein
VANVAEVRAAIDAAMLHVLEGQDAVRAARGKLGEATLGLAAAIEGSGHESVGAARAALDAAAGELAECLDATLSVVDQAKSYAAAL